MNQSALELLFQAHLDTVGCPKMERQYKFHPTRRWLLDFAHVEAILQYLKKEESK